MSNSSDMPITHWKTGPGRVACNTRKPIMYMELDRFLVAGGERHLRTCLRCLPLAQKFSASQKKGGEGNGQ